MINRLAEEVHGGDTPELMVAERVYWSVRAVPRGAEVWKCRLSEATVKQANFRAEVTKMATLTIVAVADA